MIQGASVNITIIIHCDLSVSIGDSIIGSRSVQWQKTNMFIWGETLLCDIYLHVHWLHTHSNFRCLHYLFFFINQLLSCDNVAIWGCDKKLVWHKISYTYLIVRTVSLMVLGVRVYVFFSLIFSSFPLALFYNHYFIFIYLEFGWQQLDWLVMSWKLEISASPRL